VKMKKTLIIIVSVLILIGIGFFVIFSDDNTNSTENKEVSKKTSVKPVEKDTLKPKDEKDDKDDAKKTDNEKPKGDHFVSDKIYEWDKQKLDWVLEDNIDTSKNKSHTELSNKSNPSKPVKVNWSILNDIKYKLRYFHDLDFEAYSPVFGETLKSLHKKEVIIEGFVIPMFEDKEPLALSANPYSSCFFCGQASPASVMSMYMKNKGKDYKSDDFKTFKGTLFLNYDDPNEFYYILKDAVEIDQNQ